MENNFELNIAWLYPEICNSSGDRGNIFAFKNRLEWRNIKTNIDNISLNQDINYDKYDIYFLGDMQDNQRTIIANELQKHKNSLKTLADKGTVMLAIATGYQLFGNYYQNINGDKIDGIGLLDIYTIEEKKRLTGNVTIEADFLTANAIVGFENHSGYTYLENNTLPFGKIIIGKGNNLTDKHEGARYNNVFGTYLHGALLPKNPAFCDYLLEQAIKNKLNDKSYEIPNISDTLENLTHDKLIKKAY